MSPQFLRLQVFRHSWIWNYSVVCWGVHSDLELQQLATTRAMFRFKWRIEPAPTTLFLQPPVSPNFDITISWEASGELWGRRCRQRCCWEFRQCQINYAQFGFKHEWGRSRHRTIEPQSVKLFEWFNSSPRSTWLCSSLISRFIWVIIKPSQFDQVNIGLVCTSISISQILKICGLINYFCAVRKAL